MARLRFFRLLKFVCVLVFCSFFGFLFLFSPFSNKQFNVDYENEIARKEDGFALKVRTRALPIFINITGKLNKTHDLSEIGHLQMESNITLEVLNSNSHVNYNIHTFYYAWYGNPEQDGEYYHWNHEYLPHWNKKISDKFPTGQVHVPPNDIGSTYYPFLGPYSSLDETVVRYHMLQMQEAGIGVLALSWYPPGMADDHGRPIEEFVPTIFHIASEFGIMVCFHIEPYKNRTPASVRNDLKYIMEKYSSHPAFYRHTAPSNGKKLPLLYVYDSYITPTNEWKRLLTISGDLTIRNTEIDSLLIGLLVERKHLSELANSGFDGMYTYFAADEFSYGSTRRKWREMALYAEHNNMMFIPSVGPGYDDTSVRPWNGANSKQRNDGAYYEDGWKMATTSSGVDIVSITSFNEWHEGTQIETASSESRHGAFLYQTYHPLDPNFYLKMTKKWSRSMLDKQKGLT